MSTEAVDQPVPDLSKKRKHKEDGDKSGSKKHKKSRQGENEHSRTIETEALRDDTVKTSKTSKSSNGKIDGVVSTPKTHKKDERLGLKKEKKRKHEAQNRSPESAQIIGAKRQERFPESIIDSDPPLQSQLELYGTFKPISNQTSNYKTTLEDSQVQPPEDYHTSTSSDNSPFYTQTSVFYLALSAISQRAPLEGLCAEHISPLLLTYFTPLKGIVLSYSNPRLSNGPNAYPSAGSPVLANIIDEYAVTFAWLTVDLVILRPDRGVELEGHIAVQSESHLGLICWNLFNANIAADQLPRSWVWSDARKPDKTSRDKEPAAVAGTLEGNYNDENGNPISGTIKFRVIDFEVLPSFGKDKNFMSIQGTLRKDENSTITASMTKAWSRGSSSKHESSKRKHKDKNESHSSEEDETSEDSDSKGSTSQDDNSSESLASGSDTS